MCDSDHLLPSSVLSAPHFACVARFMISSALWLVETQNEKSLLLGVVTGASLAVKAALDCGVACRIWYRVCGIE